MLQNVYKGLPVTHKRYYSSIIDMRLVLQIFIVLILKDFSHTLEHISIVLLILIVFS